VTVRLIGALAALLAASGPGLAWAQRFDEAAALAALAEARGRWAAAGLVRYRLSLEPPFPYCRAIYEIERERVLTTTLLGPKPGMGCVPPVRVANDAHTVTDLFDWIERAIRNPECGPNGCACDGYLVPVVEYDRERGHPTAAGVFSRGRESRPATPQIPDSCTMAAHVDFVKA
jgi:hypothetical protein